MDFSDALNVFYDLADEWLALSMQSKARSEQMKKGSPFALYESITAETLDSCALQLRAGLASVQKLNGGINELHSAVSALHEEWSQVALAAKEESAKSSLEGARHFGVALGLEKVTAQLKDAADKIER